jgi:hypothetical protein
MKFRKVKQLFIHSYLLKCSNNNNNIINLNNSSLYRILLSKVILIFKVKIKIIKIIYY